MVEKECESCHRIMTIRSRGMCSTCYRKYLFSVNPEFHERTKQTAREKYSKTMLNVQRLIVHLIF